jgi:cytoskeletal protein CcmA (bactofilin family)
MIGNSAKKSKTSGAKVDTLVGQQTEIFGDIHFTGGLHIDGVIKGNVSARDDSDSVAIISEGGRVEGELRVPNLLINGYVAGDVHAAERLDLAKDARVRGDVYYRTMEMASGAEVNGKLVRTDEGRQRYLEHQRDDTGADAADAASPGGEAAGEGAAGEETARTPGDPHSPGSAA